MTGQPFPQQNPSGAPQPWNAGEGTPPGAQQMQGTPSAAPSTQMMPPGVHTPQVAPPRVPAGGGIDIPGLAYQSVSPKLATVRLITVAIWVGLPLLGAVVMLIAGASGDLPGLLWTGVAFTVVFAALAVWLLWLIPRQVRAMGYAETADDLVIRKGIMFRSVRVVPYGRMQFVDVSQGPIERAFGISSVKLFTAAEATDAVIHGLPAAEAARLRDILTARGEARLAGL